VHPSSPRIVAFVQLFMDLEILLPVVAEWRRRQGTDACELWVTQEAIETHRSASRILEASGGPHFVAALEEVIEGQRPFLGGVSAVLTASETSLNPHRAARALTNRANAAGLRTYTVQHGFDNIGLTYFDHIQTPAMVDFASSRILTWGPLHRLHRDANPETRRRCVPVGCPKHVARPVEVPRRWAQDHVVAVFENLHWHRYSEGYAQRFLEDLISTAERFPDRCFLVKPHPAGRWLTGRYRGPRPQAPNLVIANPEDPSWIEHTPSALYGIAESVITTPSTVALDAARSGVPVAVTAYGMELSEYAPVTLLESAEDWADFVRGVRDPEGRALVEDRGRRFTEAATIEGDAVERILDLIVQDLRSSRGFSEGDGAVVTRRP
jgi:hypothetical protein